MRLSVGVWLANGLSPDCPQIIEVKHRKFSRLELRKHF